MLDVNSHTRGVTLFTDEMIERQIGPRTFVADAVPDFGAAVSRLFFAIVDSYSIWSRRRSIEAELYALSPHMLEDVGVIPGDIPAVANQWAKAEVKRHRAKRLAARTAKAAPKAAAVVPAMPTTAAPVTSAPVTAANDHTHSVAA